GAGTPGGRTGSTIGPTTSRVAWSACGWTSRSTVPTSGTTWDTTGGTAGGTPDNGAGSGSAAHVGPANRRYPVPAAAAPSSSPAREARLLTSRCPAMAAPVLPYPPGYEPYCYPPSCGARNRGDVQPGAQGPSALIGRSR